MMIYEVYSKIDMRVAGENTASVATFHNDTILLFSRVLLMAPWKKYFKGLYINTFVSVIYLQGQQHEYPINLELCIWIQ